MSDMERTLRKRISQLLLEKQELVEFYGNPDNYQPLQQAIVITEGNVSICTTEPPIMLDRGKKAREAG